MTDNGNRSPGDVQTGAPEYETCRDEARVVHPDATPPRRRLPGWRRRR